MSKLATAYIALGSNMGDRLLMLRHAVAELGHLDGIRIDPSGVASLWETDPVGGPAGQHPYYNSVIRVHTLLTPESLLELLLQVEHSLGRKRIARNESRAIDLDLILYDEWILNTTGVTLPHPRMHERRFVLEPLAEIAPGLVHPALGITVEDLNRQVQYSSCQSATRIKDPRWLST